MRVLLYFTSLFHYQHNKPKKSLRSVVFGWQEWAQGEKIPCALLFGLLYMIHSFDKILEVTHVNRCIFFRMSRTYVTYMNELHLHMTRRHQHHSHFNDNNLAIVRGVCLLDSLMPFFRICCMCLRITDSLRLVSIRCMHGRRKPSTLPIISW